jgi:hypothetical protein
MKQERAIVGLACLLAVLTGIYFLEGPQVPASLAAHDSTVADRPRVDAIIREHADSARALEPRVEWRERVVTRLVHRVDTLRERADTLALSGQWKSAYEARTQEADTLRVALAVATTRGDEAVQMASYWQLAYIADSTARREDQRDADRLARDLKRASTRRLTDYLVAGCIYGVKGPDCGVGVRIPIGR